MDKPDVDFIEGLSPAISIDQKSASRNPRSTVGTITEVYDYLRLLYARIGVPALPRARRAARAARRPQQIVDRILELPEGTRFQVLAPVVRGPQGRVRDAARRPGRRRASPGPGSTARSSSSPSPKDDERLARYEQHTIEVVVDRLVRREGIERRLTDSLETALQLADGVAEVEIVPATSGEGEPGDETLTFSQHLACPVGGESFEELAPRNFSFNSPYGACEHCDGLGTRFEVDPELVVPNPDLSLDEGAIAPWARRRTQYFSRLLEAVAEDQRHRPRHAVGEAAPRPSRRCCCTAPSGKVTVKYKNRYGRSRSTTTTLRGRGPVPPAPPLRRRERLEPRADRGLHARGAVPRVRRRPPQAARRSPSPSTASSIAESATCRSARRPRSSPALELSERDRMIAERVVKEINARMGFLLDVGLDYLTPRPLGRHARRRRGAAHPAGLARSAPASSACSTCSTSRRSACTSATTAG